MTLLPEKLHLILGSRAEHNDSTGWEIQPTARLLFTPTEQHTLWGAVSRAVRTPSRLENTVSYFIGFDQQNTERRLIGNNGISSERLLAYEAGYRYQPLPSLSFDLALYYHDYSSLIGVQQRDKGSLQYVPFNAANNGSAIGKGGELSVAWHQPGWLDMTLAYSYLTLSVSSNDLSTSSTPLSADDSSFVARINNYLKFVNTSPRHQISCMPVFTLPYNVKLTLWLRYVDRLPAYTEVSDYVTMDERLAWKPIPDLELSLVGQNLIKPDHMEFGADVDGAPVSAIDRSVYGKVTWHF